MRALAALLHRLARFSVARPRTVLGLWALAAAGAVSLAAFHLEVRTSNLDLIDSRLPEVRRFLDFCETFGTPNALVLVVEGPDPKASEAFVEKAADTIRKQPGVRNVMERLPLDKSLLRDLGLEEYLRSRDRRMYFLFVQPDDPRSSVESLDPFVAAVRASVDALSPARLGLRVGYTGIPQYALDDRDVIRRDTSRLTFLAFGLVLALFWASFGRFRRPMFAMAALLLGVLSTLGLVVVYPGQLTLLSASFASILFGLGVDYGIHIINRLEERLSAGEPDVSAIPAAVGDVARDIATGALTTSGIFAAMQFCGFKGFEELGGIAAMGVLICLLAMASALPALLRLFPGTSHPAGKMSPREPARIGRALAWTHRMRGWVLLTAGGLLLMLGGHPGFNYDYLELQPRDSETVRLERAMIAGSDLSTQFAVFQAPDLAAAKRLSDTLLEMHATVAEVRSAAELESVAPGENLFRQLPESFRNALVSPAGRYAVYAYPKGNIWDPVVQSRFAHAMQSLDPEVTGMPFLGHFLIDRSRQALSRMLFLGLPLLIALVYLDFRRPLPTLLAILPTLMAFGMTLGAMSWLGMAFNPINMMAMPVILGIAVDDGVHLTHRYRMEGGNLAATLHGAGRSVFLTSATTLAAFGSLALTAHRGLASFAVAASLGVFFAWAASSLLMPVLLSWASRSRWADQFS